MGARARHGTSGEAGFAKSVYIFGNGCRERLVTGQTQSIDDEAARDLIPNVARVKAGPVPA